jgi:hypothetical protein
MPDGSTLPARFTGYAHSCIDSYGECSPDAFLGFGINTDTDPNVEVSSDLSLPAGATPTYALPAPEVKIMAGPYRRGDPSEQPTLLSVVGGSIVVEKNTAAELRASIAMTLETAAHERYNLSNGSESVSGCWVEKQTSCFL